MKARNLNLVPVTPGICNGFQALIRSLAQFGTAGRKKNFTLSCSTR